MTNQKDKTVLVIDGSFATRRLVTRKLAEDSYPVYSFKTSKNILNTLSRQGIKLDLILIDIMLKNNEGLKFLIEARQHVNYSKVPIVVFTTNNQRETVIFCLKMGVADFIIKPPGYTPEKLNAVMKKVYKQLGDLKVTAEEIERNSKLKKINFFQKAKTPYEKIEVIISEIENLLALPFSVVKVIKMTSDRHINASQLAKPIEADPAIGSIILRRANSVAYAAVNRIGSIKQAVTRIGVNETRNIASTAAIFKLFSKTETTSGFNKVEFWAHSLGTGVCSQMISRALGFSNHEDCYLGGLVHDLGKMILDDYLQDEFQKVIDETFVSNISMHKVEHKRFKVDHNYIGSRVADKWHFPKRIVTAIAESNSINTHLNSEDTRNIGAMIFIGNLAAKVLLIGNSGDYLIPEESIKAWSRIVTKKIKWEKISGLIIESFHEYAELLQIPEEHKPKFPSDESIPEKINLFLPNFKESIDLLELFIIGQFCRPNVIFNLDKEVNEQPTNQDDKEEKEAILTIAVLTECSEEEALNFSKIIQGPKIIIGNTGKIAEEITFPLNTLELARKFSEKIKVS